MLKYCIQKISRWVRLKVGKPCTHFGGAPGIAVITLILLGVTGCQTPTPYFRDLDEQHAPKSDGIVLHEGDSVRITFPGAASLNTVQQIRRDGRITLDMLGEFKAAGMTPADMQKELLRLYGPQLQTKEVTVAVESSAFPIYVTGAVRRPGKIMSDRPITAIEAIMEAGGFDTTKANLKAVGVIRYEGGRAEHHTLNLKRVLQGEQTESFDLRPHDIIFVPERFAWF